uniref:MHC class I-like antigen recognition-like domain-containing protein n=1 Tax=Pongo abelii TaxID=9601 RepID=H2PID7_PONAB
MELSLVLLFLTCTALFAPQGAAAEPHSLHYNLTVLSWDGSVQSGFLAEGHLDGQLFLLCDRQKGRAGPRGQWAEAVLGAETWDTETKDLTENEQELRRTLAHIKGQRGGRGDKYMKVLDSVTDQCWVSSSCNFRTTMNTKRILKTQSCLEGGSHL